MEPGAGGSDPAEAVLRARSRGGAVRRERRAAWIRDAADEVTVRPREAAHARDTDEAGGALAVDHALGVVHALLRRAVAESARVREVAVERVIGTARVGHGIASARRDVARQVRRTPVLAVVDGDRAGRAVALIARRT